ncbi:hypothetical protein [Paludisphaera mucosa]|uniref:Uncharacterized protein n=1 Tax=Paludisphaera mucosa TaxID=3030827 RepID=A0ABT6FKU2_9BACT|nr:hypothetical protein [Paludisphaera mucosa]MDG3008197.1 hypothetical protein [Paludisphaera mucosa]
MDDLRTPKDADLADMMETYARMVRLQGRIQDLLRRLEQAQGYLDEPGSNQFIGRERYERARVQCSDAIVDLRDARHLAHRWLNLAERRVGHEGPKGHFPEPA